ncbi:MAG: 50S ribosomal protein L1 [Opitutaceae bacterium]|nr:50S ribosomal protein L1 [Opitutaceae bacterium]
MSKNTKKYRASLEVADLEKDYSIADAVEVLYKFSKAKFDETIELFVRLSADPRQGEQMVRGTVVLPHGSGKKVKVLAFTNDAEAALAAGADHAGLKDYMEKISEGWLDFDVAVATPEAMREVRTIARVLGPKGLMPNPKSGTVSVDIEEAIKAVKAGRVEFKMDKTANIGVGIGKYSFSPEQITENIKALIEAIGNARPAGLKGRYILNVAVSATMTPSVTFASGEYVNL